MKIKKQSEFKLKPFKAISVESAVKICKLLNINPNVVHGLQIVLEAGKIPKIIIESYTDEEKVFQIADILASEGYKADE